MQAVQRPINPATRCTVPVAIYTRVSTLGQVGGRFDSCESQAAICREHILKQAAEGLLLLQARRRRRATD